MRNRFCYKHIFKDAKVYEEDALEYVLDNLFKEVELSEFKKWFTEVVTDNSFSNHELVEWFFSSDWYKEEL